MDSPVPYDRPGVLTRLPAQLVAALGPLGDEPVELCRPVIGWVVQPRDAQAAGIPEERMGEANLRPAAAMFSRLLELNPDPAAPRPERERVVGTCRHFALLACALLRQRSIPARLRCGFATYFQPGEAVDHWIVEHRRPDRPGWVRLDAEILGTRVVEHPEDLRPGQFVSGAEAWAAYRRGEIDADTFGVHGTDNYGAAEIRGNAVKDLAALNAVEMLPWDEWGQMTEAYEGRTGPEYDDLLDAVAAAAGADDAEAIRGLFAHPDLRVPASMLS